MTEQALQGRVAVVTGSSRGIGRGIAVGLGEAGATVYITGRSVGDGPLTIDTTAAMVTEAGGTGIAVATDFFDDGQIEALYAQIDSEQGRLDIHVNNAFKIPDPPVWGGKFWEHPIQVWDDQVGIGLRAAYVASVHAVKLMMRSDDSLKFMTNISSSGSERYALSTSYGIAKSGTDRLTRDFAVEGKDDGLVVVGLWPSQVLTEFILDSIEKGDISLDQTTQKRRSTLAASSRPSPPTATGPLAAARFLPLPSWQSTTTYVTNVICNPRANATRPCFESPSSRSPHPSGSAAVMQISTSSAERAMCASTQARAGA